LHSRTNETSCFKPLDLVVWDVGMDIFSLSVKIFQPIYGLPYIPQTTHANTWITLNVDFFLSNGYYSP
jgi:homogentisate 1,2-dioxygenase